MLEIEYRVQGLTETAEAILDAGNSLQDLMMAELSMWEERFMDVAKSKEFPKDDRIRGFDSRRAGQPRLRDFWRSELSPYVGVMGDGAQLEIWNEHPQVKNILFPTKPHRIPAGGEAEMRQRGYKLRYFDYGGGMHKQWESQHPGTPGQPVHEETFEALSPLLEEHLENIATSFARRITET
tara:strand:- start:1059 stop:1601 length:543 start_codon:yes stop_codon:yes gene_type:complete